MSHTITLIEDHIELAQGLASNLELEGHRVTLCHDGADAIEHIRKHQPDLLILDMMLPHRDGFQIIEDLQRLNWQVPTLCLTARSTEMDKVRALRSGADDYLTKPFGLMELLARVEALLRRRSPTGTNQTLTLGPLSINSNTKEVKVHGRLTALAPKEFELLWYLANHPGTVFTRLELLQAVWQHQGAINSRTVDTHIAEVRKKCQLGPDASVQIKTIPKTGYQLVLTPTT